MQGIEDEGDRSLLEYTVLRLFRMCKMQDAEGKGIRKYMEPYIFVHMMTSVDGRIDCPMVG